MDDTITGATDQLLRLVVEQIKLPLIHIARLSELYSQSDAPESLANITNIADMTNRLIDSYILSMGNDNQLNLTLEPVSLSAVLQDVANNLYGVSKVYDCDVDLRLGGKYAPVVTDRARLEAAFTMLGLSIMESGQVDVNRKKITLATYKTPKGVSGGVFTEMNSNFNNKILKKSLVADGRYKQSFPDISHTSGAGIMVAARLLNGISSQLRVAKHKKLNGFATTLTASQQLQLV